MQTDLRSLSRFARPLHITAIAILVVAASFLSVAPASARSLVHVSAIAVAPDEGDCTSPPPGYETYTDFVMQLHGDLEGCWYISVSWGHMQSNGRYNEVGREVFVGTINGKAGTFTTVYWFTGLYDTETGEELSGGCLHPIVRGYGGLAGISGVLRFIDVIDDDPNGPIADMSGTVRF